MASVHSFDFIRVKSGIPISWQNKPKEEFQYVIEIFFIEQKIGRNAVMMLRHTARHTDIQNIIQISPSIQSGRLETEWTGDELLPTLSLHHYW